MKKHLLMLLAVLGIATAFTSCQKDNEEESYQRGEPMSSWYLYLYLSDSEGADLLQNITSGDIESENFYSTNIAGDYDQYWYDGASHDVREYWVQSSELASSINRIDSYYADLLGTSNKFLPVSLTVTFQSYDSYGDFLPEVLTFDVYCPVAFGDNQMRTLTVNLEYPNNLSFEHIVKSATLDGVQLDTRTIQSDSIGSLGGKRTYACVLNYTLE